MADATNTTRRYLLKAAPAVLVASAVPARQAKPAGFTDTPIATLFGEWRTYNDWLNSNATAHMADEDFDAACSVGRRMVRDMLALPAQDARDVLAKIMALTEWGQVTAPIGAENFAAIRSEARALIAG